MKKRMKKVATLCLAGVTAMSNSRRNRKRCICKG